MYRRLMLMPTVRFQVLVIPYALDAFAEVAYAVGRLREGGYGGWHGLTGSGSRQETPLEAARRHASQHFAVPGDAAYLALDSRTMIPDERGAGARGIPEYAFGVRADPEELSVPAEYQHSWVSYHVATGLLSRDAERNAIWELRRRLGHPHACR
jgi:hypothetical protein